MKERKATPLEFGLKVRADKHVPLIVTAPNKMRNASLKVINSSLSEDLVETPYFNNHVGINQQNLKIVQNLLRHITVSKDRKGRYGAQNVDAELIIELLDSIDVPGININFDPQAIARFIKKYAGQELNQWDVTLISGGGREFIVNDNIRIDTSERQYELRNDGKYIKINRSRLGNTSDPTYGLSDYEVNMIKEDNRITNKGKAIASKRYFSSLVKDRKPLLMLYFIALKGDNEGTQNFGDVPLVGFAVGIPHLADEETKYIGYQTNLIYQSLGALDDDYGDDDFDD